MGPNAHIHGEGLDVDCPGIRPALGLTIYSHSRRVRFLRIVNHDVDPLATAFPFLTQT